MTAHDTDSSVAQVREVWPALPYEAWKDTCTALHLWTQIVGKVRVAQTPWLNHSWHVPLYVNARGLTTGPVTHGPRTFDITFDLVDHVLSLRTSDGAERRIKLRAQSVADFYTCVMDALEALEVPVDINTRPNEVPHPVPFPEDHVVRPYDANAAHDFWRALTQVDRVFCEFRTGFLGKCSPVHFFWGSFDLAVTRFSGRSAPVHPGGLPGLPDAVTRDAYSHELSSAGFWPGGNGMEEAAFYSYAYPEPGGYRAADVQPAEAYFEPKLGEFILPYDVVRTAADPDRTLEDFLHSTYEAAANLGHWARDQLESAEGRVRIPRQVRSGG
ncbi:DUF5996 family protein [Actinopolymorpha pittospori]|uniref:Ava_C0101 and related proteins n=1 Tax=Actinopolymorpha pittospori TaxID=648752 RepID=A0A927RCL2_9ACTN|nr:hypothetical protein [Actinopolymorpha pittospori]